MDVGAMTGDEVRALCLGLPEVTEKLIWGDAEHMGHPTFRAWARTAPKRLAAAWPDGR